ncbi:catalase family peroxidase [Alteromonas sp. A081]|uniref:catalase family peroxidase n=1 Tax=Alteromonas sp. A081 TaxID=3410269 RepID=UPI003B981A3F
MSTILIIEMPECCYVNRQQEEKNMNLVVKRVISASIAVGLVLNASTALAEQANLSTTVTAQDFVNLQQGGHPHKGYRRAHAKGVCVTGEFISNGKLAEFTSASLFAQGKTPFIGRFSIAGNDPHGADLKAPVRSLALNFTLSASNQWRIAMNTPPVMAVTNPQDFYAQLVAIKSGPEAIASFFNAHPESEDFLSWKAQYSPANSFSDETYHSINAFYLEKGTTKHAVRWSVSPATAATFPPETGDNALHNMLKKQLNAKPISFNWLFQFADASDDPNNPAVKWPETRYTVSAGQIVIYDWQEQLQGKCHGTNFDPNVLPQGMSATDDPILKARSAAYAESYKRRAIEEFNGALNKERGQ